MARPPSPSPPPPPPAYSNSIPHPSNAAAFTLDLDAVTTAYRSAHSFPVRPATTHQLPPSSTSFPSCSTLNRRAQRVRSSSSTSSDSAVSGGPEEPEEEEEEDVPLDDSSSIVMEPSSSSPMSLGEPMANHALQRSLTTRHSFPHLHHRTRSQYTTSSSSSSDPLVIASPVHHSYQPRHGDSSPCARSDARSERSARSAERSAHAPPNPSHRSHRHRIVAGVGVAQQTPRRDVVQRIQSGTPTSGTGGTSGTPPPLRSLREPYSDEGGQIHPVPHRDDPSRVRSVRSIVSAPGGSISAAPPTTHSVPSDHSSFPMLVRTQNTQLPPTVSHTTTSVCRRRHRTARS